MKGISSLSVLRLWLYASGALVVMLVLWSVAPVVFFLLLLAAALGLLSMLIVFLARKLEAWKGPPPDAQ